MRSPTHFLFCQECGYHKDIDKIINSTDFTSLVDIQNNLRKFSCSSCGAKNVTIKEKPTGKAIIEYVGTMQSTGKVFHKSTCSWMRHVSMENEVRFRDRDSAIKRGFKPCASCRP
jgi:hypothetical protein